MRTAKESLLKVRVFIYSYLRLILTHNLPTDLCTDQGHFGGITPEFSGFFDNSLGYLIQSLCKINSPDYRGRQHSGNILGEGLRGSPPPKSLRIEFVQIDYVL